MKMEKKDVKIGMRVRCTCDFYAGSPKEGWVGTVKGAYRDDAALVTWDKAPMLDDYSCFCHYINLEPIEQQPQMENNELKITKEKVLAAAAKCSTAEATLKVLFPEAFKKEDEYYDFGRQATITTKLDGPLFIGHGFAPVGMEFKCLVVSNVFELEVSERCGSKILAFKKKKS